MRSDFFTLQAQSASLCPQNTQQQNHLQQGGFVVLKEWLKKLVAKKNILKNCHSFVAK
jgi:hypothetical protein